MVQIREAVVGDADALCDVHVASWRVAYRGLFPASYLDSDAFADSRRVNWRAGRWLDRTHATLHVADADGAVIGFGHAGAERNGHGNVPAVPTGRGELYSFYLDPDAWGSGVSRTLIETCTESLRERGFTEAVLWVLRDNARAVAFYAKAGWTPTGEVGTWAPVWEPRIPEVAEIQLGITL